MIGFDRGVEQAGEIIIRCAILVDGENGAFDPFGPCLTDDRMGKGAEFADDAGTVDRTGVLAGCPDDAGVEPLAILGHDHSASKPVFRKIGNALIAFEHLGRRNQPCDILIAEGLA